VEHVDVGGRAAHDTLSESDGERMTRVLGLFSWLCAGAALGVAALFALTAPTEPWRAWAGALYFVSLGAATALGRRRAPRRTSALLALGIWGAVTLLAIESGGVHAPALLGSGLAVVVGGLLLGAPGAIAFSALGIMTATALLVLERQEILPGAPGLAARSVAAWLGHVITLGLTGIAVTLASRAFTAALERALDDEHRLRQLNADLTQSQAALARRARRQEALTALTQRALTRAEPDALGAHCVQVVREALDAAMVDLFEFHSFDGAVALIASTDWSTDASEREALLAEPPRQAGYTVRVGHDVLSGDLHHETRFAPSRRQARRGVRASMSTLIAGRGEPYGVLVVGSERPDAFGPDDSSFIEAVAAAMGAARAQWRAETSLRLSERRYADLVRASPDGIVVLDGAGRIELLNPAIARLAGLQTAELIGVPFWDLSMLVGASSEAARAAFDQVAQGGPSGRIELEVRRADGSTFPVEGNPHRVERPDGAFGVQVILRDISARRAAEAEREVLQARLRQAQKLEALGRLSAGVAHDFNNLLTVILANADIVLTDDRLDQDTASAVRSMRHAGKRAAELTRQLLAFGRRQVMEPTILDLNEVIGSLGAVLRQLMGSAVVVRERLAPTPMRALMDISQFEQVLINLAINARDAMPVGGEFTIETLAVSVRAHDSGPHVSVPAGQWLLLRIRDTGAGMDAHTLDHVFDPFFTTKEPGKGTGLGLASVHGIIAQSGGHILCSSAPGQGAEFRIYLPQAGGSLRLVSPAGNPGGSATLSTTVLLTEDDDDVRRATRAILERAGFDVIEARAGDEAIARFDEGGGSIGLLVTDVVMPGMSGAALAQRLAARAPGLRVLYVSGYAADVLGNHGLRDRGRGFLAKPFTSEQLVDAVQGVLCG
jgi:two-component system cell cycle sensor histidine kinase/response regulator CckA